MCVCVCVSESKKRFVNDSTEEKVFFFVSRRNKKVVAVSVQPRSGYIDQESAVYLLVYKETSARKSQQSFYRGLRLFRLCLSCRLRGK